MVNILLMFRYILALLITLHLLTAEIQVMDDDACVEDSGSMDPSHQSVFEMLADVLQKSRNKRLITRVVRRSLRDPGHFLRRMLGSAAADPLSATENLDEPPIRTFINKNVLDLLAAVLGETRTVLGYLWHYGFIPKVMNKSLAAAENYKGVIPPCAVTNAVKEFQIFNQIEPANGVLTKETRDLMTVERCGNADVQCETEECLAENDAGISNSVHGRHKRYVVHDRKWRGKVAAGELILNYFFDPEHFYDSKGPNKKRHDQNMGKDIVKKQVEKGLERWTKYAPIHFIEVDNANDADINIRFGKYEHGEKNKKYHFDGKSGILAHMFFPPSGKMHFDESENFTSSTVGPGINLETITAHEMGHGLGIMHSSLWGSIMTPYYLGYIDKLRRDDTAAVQSLYGVGSGSVVPLSVQRACVAGEWREHDQCVKCPVNSYSDTEDATECPVCPNQGKTQGTGATSVTLCETNESNAKYVANEGAEWLNVKKQSKIQLDMRTEGLTIKSSAELNKNRQISLSFLSHKRWMGAFRLFLRKGQVHYTLKYCTPTYDNYYKPQIIPDIPWGLVTGQDDLFDIMITQQKLQVSINGVTIIEYNFTEKSGKLCAYKYKHPVTAIVFWKVDSISGYYRHSQLQLFET